MTNGGHTDFWIVAQAAALYRLSPVEPSEAETAVSAWVHSAQAEAVRNGVSADSRYRGFAAPPVEFWQDAPKGGFRGPPAVPPVDPSDPYPFEPNRPDVNIHGETGHWTKDPKGGLMFAPDPPPPPPEHKETMKCCPISIDIVVKRRPKVLFGRKCALWKVSFRVRLRESDECSSSCCTIKYMAGGRITRKKKGADTTNDLGSLRSQRNSPYRLADFHDPAATSDPFLLFADREVGYLAEDIGIGLLPTGGKLPDGTTEYQTNFPFGGDWVNMFQDQAANDKQTPAMREDMARIVRALEQGDLEFLRGRVIHSGDENSNDTEVGETLAGGERPITIRDNPGACADKDETVTITRKYTVLVYPKANEECRGGGRMQRSLRLSVTFHGEDTLEEIKNKQKEQKGPKVRGAPR